MKKSKRFWRSLLFLVLIAALCGGLALPMLAPVRAAPQLQSATDLVISEFRVRGSAGINDEFIEIYNPTNGIVDLNGWKIQRSNAAGVINDQHLFTVSILLNPGQHYLVAHPTYDDAVLPDATYSTGSTGIVNAGGIALIRPDNSIADQAGITNCGSCFFETTPLTSFGAINLDQSYERKLGGTFDSCQDTGDNFGDFTNIPLSNPQNSSSFLSLCGVILPTSTPTSTPSNTPTVTNTATATATNSPTNTSTPTVTSTPTNTGTPLGFLSVIINEVAWAGTTAALTSDEWIELYNPGASPVNLAGWILKSPDGTPTINLTGVIPAGGYFLLERTDDTTVSDIGADQFYTGDLGNSNEILNLLDPSNRLIDSANSNGGNWPAGSSSTFGSMERRAVTADSDTAWFTNTGVVRNGLNANGGPINGTPKNLNWAYTVTSTPTATPTITRTPTRTRTPTLKPTQTRPPTLAPQPLVAINEFVPRPGHDWNNDGFVNVEDEYVEIINHGTISVSLSGYSLDDEVNIGSQPYRLPAITLKPGERVVFYGSETGLLFSDGGDGVRFYQPNGQVKDAYNYSVVRFPDQSYCRLPDNGGLDDWNTNCYPTPGLPNALRGNFVNPPDNVEAEMLCPIADTLPLDFILAECPPFGNNIWRPAYWDNPGWYGENFLPESPGKWPVFVD